MPVGVDTDKWDYIKPKIISPEEKTFNRAKKKSVNICKLFNREKANIQNIQGNKTTKQ